jgi:hypothetical protein
MGVVEQREAVKGMLRDPSIPEILRHRGGREFLKY